MTEFMLELYVSKSCASCDAIASTAEKFGAAAAEQRAQGTPVRLLRSILVPEDETCFLLVEAATADDVHETARRARLPFERVVEAAVDLVESELGADQ